MNRRARKFYNNIINVLKQPEMLILPGQLAFFFILSVVPILTIISYFAPSLNLSIDFITEFITKEFGETITSLIIPTVTNPTISFAFIITIIVGFFFASNGAASMIVASNTIYNIKDKGFVHRRIKAMIMTIFIVLLLIFILVVPVFGNKIVALLNSINIPSSIANIINLFQGPLSWLIIFIFIKILFTLAPDEKIPSKHMNYGAIFTSIGWILSTEIYSFYINHYNHYSLFYGGLANLIILMLWVYLLSYIFTIGIALNYHNSKDIEK